MIDKEKLKRAVKQKDGWWASVFSGPLANFLLCFIANVKFITPNIITTFSLFLCFVTAVLASFGTQPYLMIAAFLLQMVFVFDCMDGQLARYRNQSSNFGAWYDRVTDRIKDFLIFFSIGFGHFKVYQDWKIWPLTMASLFFIYLFDYYVNQDIKLEPRAASPELRAEKNFLIKLLNPVFLLGEKVYRSVPILQFHIGEQYLLTSIFLFFNQTRLLFYLIVLLGIFYMFYWPLAQYYGRKPVS